MISAMRRRPVVLFLMLILSAAPADAQCSCDCDGNGRVGVNDLIRLVLRFIGQAEIDACPGMRNIHIPIEQFVACVNTALSRTECTPATASPTITTTATATITPTFTPSRMPTQTPISFPPADAVAATLATELLESIATRVCQTGITPGGRFEVASTPAGAHLECDSFTGHNGRFDLVKYPSVEAARDFFGEPRPEWTVDDAGGGILRELRWVPPCCPHLGGVGTQWGWRKDCWLAGGSTFDDTHYILTPQGAIVVGALVASGRLDELSALCGPR
jgi:hypothetical protein